MMEQLRSKRAPHWGFYGQLLRAAMDALLLYLPRALMGLVPPTPSYITALPTEQYYWYLVWLAPLVLAAEWLLGSAFIHLVLRLSGRRSDFDQLLNIGGMVALVVGAFILVWDWVWFTVGGGDQYFLGFTHLVIRGNLPHSATKRLLPLRCGSGLRLLRCSETWLVVTTLVVCWQQRRLAEAAPVSGKSLLRTSPRFLSSGMTPPRPFVPQGKLLGTTQKLAALDCHSERSEESHPHMGGDASLRSA